ncbi:MAG TPA: alanine--glyoxylate aminotransferase family protein [Thiotrichaceae bacterium]|jgi:alanine-glyoxylate transaminase/serine-glyoxylate transaminase/serine-pyruvate transaminase|nr:alanine--glyoxylate aminotransferase family protein [Thiotrichaceae bacterium]
MSNELISPLSGLRRLIESGQIDAPDDFLKDKAPVWSPHNKIVNVTPGPAFGSELVTQFTSNQTRGMRGPGVAEFFTAVRAEYGRLVDMQEGGRALFFTGSGTSGTEAAAGSCRTPEEAGSDKPAIVTLEIGAFSTAMGNCVENLGRNVIRIKGEIGEDLPFEKCREVLANDKEGNIKMVMAPHNETGAGVTTDPKKLRDLLDELNHDALLVIDGISSIASMPCSMTKMGIDMLIGCSQKGMMGTPGIGMLSLSPKAIEKVREYDKQLADAGIKKGQHYLNLGKMIDAMESTGLHLETPSNYAQFAVALDSLAIEGIDRVCERHKDCSEVFRAAALGAGFELVAKDVNTRSNAVTAIKTPEGFGEKEVTQVLRIMFNKHAVEAAGIPGAPALGWRLCATGGIQPQHALSASIAFLKSCEEAGLPVDADKGILAASKAYSEVAKYHRPLPGIDVYGR